jgi:hypothetical protein
MKFTIKKDNLVRLIEEETRKVIKEGDMKRFKDMCITGLDHKNGRIVKVDAAGNEIKDPNQEVTEIDGEVACKFNPGGAKDLDRVKIVTFKQYRNGVDLK